MSLGILDWIIIVAYLLVSLGIGLYYRQRAGKSLGEFFLGGRNLPWHVAGISMVATTFAADTPLAVNELVYKNGISGNWVWWCALFGGMLTAFFFARLWRRSEVMTEVELIELRYGGKLAAFLRGFRAVYLGLFMNTIILGWVNLAMMTILQVYFGMDTTHALLWTGACMLLTALYSSISGLMGVAITDMVQFVIAMAGCIILAILMLNSDQVGGVDGLKEKLPAAALSFFPQTSGVSGALNLSIGAFIAFLGVQWWASWYPGAEPGGGGYIAQRMMSAKDEKHAIYATLFFQVAHYCLRPWPWIIVGLCTLVVYPGLVEDAERRAAYVHAMQDFLPAGLQGLMLVAFLAAYMSTISTQLNWGSSYVINDIYKRFYRKEKSFANTEQAEKHYVQMSKIATIVIMLFALGVTPFLTSVSKAWEFIFSCGAGLGFVLILRWWWWRINAKTEIVATIAPFIPYSYFSLVFMPNLKANDIDAFNAWESGHYVYFITVGFTVLAALATVFLTKPESKETLAAFYKKVQPGGWWAPVAEGVGTKAKAQVLPLVVCWISAVIFTYSLLFLTGSLIFKEWNQVLVFSATAIVSLIVLKVFVARTRIFEA
jgi:solute:Na+ symporter, SSS family